MYHYDGMDHVLCWFNAELSEHMELYVEPNTGAYVLMEKYHCDILTTSRVYVSPADGRERILPPNAWNSTLLCWKVNPCTTTHFMNGRNTYTFTTLVDLVTYLKIVHATKDTIPFLKYKRELQEEHLSKLVDADSRLPAMKTWIRKEKIYISS